MTTVLRPAFHEGQILAATDLGATVDFPRERAARHDRYLHEWGIAEGLTLEPESLTDPVTGKDYLQVTVRPGMALDGTGREIVVPEPVILQESEFKDLHSADPVTTEPYPVFLAGFDDDRVPVTLTGDRCGTTAGATRVDETYLITFGKPGEQRRPPDPVAVDDGPGSDPDRWRILIGYVVWDGNHIVGAPPADTSGIAPPRAGARAAVVAAPAGRLTMRSRPVADAALVLRIDDIEGLQFGKAAGGGDITPVLSVTPAGDLQVLGSMADAPRRGDVIVSSGTVNHGLKLPLPPGVDPDRVASGSILLHVQLRPMPTPESRSTAETWIDTILDCSVGGDLTVVSRVRAVKLTSSFTHIDRTVPATYVLIAVAAEPGDGGQP